jgi:hypothetical protein
MFFNTHGIESARLLQIHTSHAEQLKIKFAIFWDLSDFLKRVTFRKTIVYINDCLFDLAFETRFKKSDKSQKIANR